ncbi:MAG: 3-oxoadipyl-CoA thiolase [Flavobacteriia bacterium]|nr:3-oxoadipyl-CoA thiolase [Flavobacteriia bacterium]
MSKEAYLIDGIRTPIGNFGGSLSTVRADDLAAFPIKALIEKIPHLDLNQIEEVILGCANQAGEDNRNVARMALLLAGIPFKTAGETINRLCASGMAACINSSRAIKDGAGDLYIAGGIEHMTRGPWVISKTSSAFGRDAQMYDSSFGWRFINPIMKEKFGTEGMGETAENLAEMFKISREDQDKFAIWSQQKTSIANEKGIFKEEICPVTIPMKKGESLVFEKDEFVKSNSTLEGLSQLKPAFRKEGSVTAGNASGLNDGAAALLFSSENGLKINQLKPKCRIVAGAVSGVEPRIMGIGPVEAIQKVLKRSGLTLNDIDVIELNEAFAVQVLACTRQLGLDDFDPRININGGAIALGHPLGMSGARIILSAANELHRSNKKYALASMCVGVGQGYACIMEKV